MCDNRPLARRVEICILFSFPIFIVKNIGNICESRGSGTPDASVFFFLVFSFEAVTRLNASKCWSPVKRFTC